MKIVNLTPHQITLVVTGNGVDYGKEQEVFVPSSGLARVQTVDVRDGHGYAAMDEPADWPDGGNFNITERSFGDIIGLPEPEPLTMYVVSMPVAQRAAELGRADVYAPDTGASAIRSENGQIKAVRGLVRYRSK